VKRAALAVGAVACLALATFLVLLAADVLRLRDALRADDVSYRTAPGGGDLWQPTALVPFGATRSLLGVTDDVAFRQAVRALRLARLDEARTSDPKVVLQRAEAQARLEAIGEGRGDPTRRSRAKTLLAVLRLSTPAANPQERASNLRAAVASLQDAISLDPGNDEAKYNLETALRRSRGVQTVQGGPAPNSSAGPGSSRGAATGAPGRGY
jgi:hypothetical protein